MKTVIRLVLISMLLIVTVSVYAQECVQMWKCEMDDQATEEQVLEMAAKWLAGAKATKGGENLKAYVYFPVAVNMVGETDFMFVVIAPSFEEWGIFWDNFHGSEAEAIEDEQVMEWIACPDSALWQLIPIK